MTLAELFSKPGTWTQGMRAQDNSGRAVAEHWNTAVRFCLIGGYGHCYYGKGEQAKAALSALTGEFTDASGDSMVENLTDWNDTPGRTQAEVQALCERLGI